MDFLGTWIDDWLKGLLVEGIMGNLSDLFGNVNTQVGDIAANVGMTPWAFNPGVFALIRTLSETVVLPIAGLLLTFVSTWELIQMIVEQNHMHHMDTWVLFKWTFKTAATVLILSNTFNIVMAIFDMSQHVVNNAAGIISGSTAITLDIMATLEADLMLMEVGSLIVLLLQSFLMRLTVIALDIIVFIIVYGRMIEIYILTSLAPLPMATLTSRHMGGMGGNYLRSLFAVGFQGLLIMVCLAIYAALVRGIAVGGDPIMAIWNAIGYTVLLCLTLFKTGSISKSIFHSH